MIRFSVLSILCAVMLATSFATADDWPQWRGPTRDGVWHETGIVEKFDAPQLEHVWSVEVSNGYSSPTVADGRVYLMDRMTEPTEVERVLCFDASTGAELWVHAYATTYKSVGYRDGPRASVTVANGRAFAFGTMGHFFALDAATGEVLWEKTPGKDYDIPMPVWGMVSAPLADGENVIVQMGARGGACIVALDAATGEERWRALDDKASYSPPIIVEQAGREVLVCWTGENIAGLDPDSGEVLWSNETPANRVIINIAAPILEDGRMFLTSFYDGSYMFRLTQDSIGVEKLWHRIGRSERETDALHSINSTPVFIDGHIYGPDSYGEFRCLNADTGDRVWEDQRPVPKSRWATIHSVMNGDRVWMFNEKGELIIATLSPSGYNEISRAQLIEPTAGQYTGSFSAPANSKSEDGGKPMFTNESGVTWSHPAYANKHVFIRNDTHLVSANLAAE